MNRSHASPRRRAIGRLPGSIAVAALVAAAAVGVATAGGRSTAAAAADNGCPSPAQGATSVSVNDINAPARLQIANFAASPRTIPGGFRSFKVLVHVSDTCGHPVQGADVYATAVPFHQVSVPSMQKTDGQGDTTLEFNRLSGFPAASHQQLMVLFIRASKPGDNILGGISTRRLVSLRVDLNRNL